MSSQNQNTQQRKTFPTTNAFRIFMRKSVAKMSYIEGPIPKFENLQKLFKNITLYLSIDPFLSLHYISIST